MAFIRDKRILNNALAEKYSENTHIDYIKKIELALLYIMKDHIGRANSIETSKLFKKIFVTHFKMFKNGDGVYNPNNHAHWLLWTYTKEAMSKLRKKSYCFIAGAYNHDSYEYEFFVVEDMEDAQCYIDLMNKNIKAMQNAKKRVVTAVKNKWCLKDWGKQYLK